VHASERLQSLHSCLDLLFYLVPESDQIIFALMFGSPLLFGSIIGSNWKDFVQIIQQIFSCRTTVAEKGLQTVYSNVFNGRSALKSTSL
jgi:hypothetical protein